MVLYFSFPLFSFPLFCSLSGIKLKFLSSLCCSTTVIRHIWNDTSHTCNLFSWYLYWYLMYVVKQCCNYIQYYRVCTIRLYGYMIIQGIWSFRHLVSKKCKGCGYNVIFFLLFLLWFQNGLFLILDLSSITDGGYMYIYSCELIRHTSSKVIRWNFYAADDTAFDNRFVQLLYFSLLVLLKWLIQYLQSVCFFLTKQFCYLYKL